MSISPRSLRSMRIRSLTELLRDVTHEYLGVGTECYASREREAWKRDETSAAREACVARTGIEIRAEIAILQSISDEVYEQATRELPLSYWPISPHELRHYARSRGIEGRAWHEKFEGFGRARAGMGGYGWFRTGGEERLSYDDVLPILGHNLASSQDAPQWAANE